MSITSSFILPGAVTLQLKQRLLYELSFAYSRRWNSRRLEGHLYGFWGDILNALIADLAPNLFVVSQYKIFTYGGNKESNPEHSFGSEIGNSKATGIVPDFSIINAKVVLRSDGHSAIPDHLDLEQWDDMRIEMVQSPLLVEAKRPPRRGFKDPNRFIGELLPAMEFAMGKLTKVYARFAFRGYKDMAAIVLIAVVGEWWQYKVVKRGEYYMPGVEIPEDYVEPGMENIIGRVTEEEKEDADAQNVSDTMEELQFLGAPSEDAEDRCYRHTYYILNDTANIVQSQDLSSPENAKLITTHEGSGLMLIGTKVSNHHLSFIHKFLRRVKFS